MTAKKMEKSPGTGAEEEVTPVAPATQGLGQPQPRSEGAPQVHSMEERPAVEINPTPAPGPPKAQAAPAEETPKMDEKKESAPQGGSAQDLAKVLADALRGAAQQPTAGPALPLEGFNQGPVGGKFMVNNRWVNADNMPITELSAEEKKASKDSAAAQAKANNAMFEPDSDEG